jgi:polyisoprenoid-binding protein YceI
MNARKLSVKPDKGVTAKDQAEVQSNMQTKVLESSAYPEILSRSNQVSPTHDNSWRLSGDLTLHGTTNPVIIDVTSVNGAYIGTIRIRQTDFGI